jgi:uncharacterized membrane protein
LIVNCIYERKKNLGTSPTIILIGAIAMILWQAVVFYKVHNYFHFKMHSF